MINTDIYSIIKALAGSNKFNGYVREVSKSQKNAVYLTLSMNKNLFNVLIIQSLFFVIVEDMIIVEGTKADKVRKTIR